MTTISQISLGVTDAERAGEFWRQALGYQRRPARFDADDWIVLEPAPGMTGSTLAMDVSESPTTQFPRIHLDLDAGDRDLDQEVDRLVALGAHRVDWQHYPQDPHPSEPAYVVLADPEGNRFCIAGRRSTSAATAEP